MVKARCVGCGKKTALHVPSSTPGVVIALCWTCQKKRKQAEDLMAEIKNKEVMK